MPDVFSENVDIWCLLTLCATQWRVSGLGAVTGLDYQVIFQAAEIMGVKVDALFLQKLRAMEGKSLELMNKKNTKEKNG